MSGRDGRLDLEGTGAGQAPGGGQTDPALGDLAGVVEGPVLVAQQDQVTGGVDPGRTAGVVEQHERKQPEGLGLVGHQRAEGAAQADGLVAERPPHQVAARAGRVPLVEEQIDDGQHRRGALEQLVGGRDDEGDAGVADLALGPDEPLGHGRFGNEEGAGDLGRRHADQRAQGQRDTCLEGQRGMAAGEDEAEAIVGDLLGPVAIGRR